MTTNDDAAAPGATPVDWYAAIIMRAGMPAIECYASYAEAVEHLRRWYAAILREDHTATDRQAMIAEFSDPATATVDGMCAFYAVGEPDVFWCDVVPVAAVLNRIAPTLLRTHDDQVHAALVLADGLVNAQPCASYDQALAALRSQATAWEHDDPTLDPDQASIADLAQVYSDDSAGQWLGIMPILATDAGPAVLVPIDRLPAQI